MYSKKRQFGNIGEKIAVKKLQQQGFVILEQNYLRKWGEIDIVARATNGVVHFVEVKCVSRDIPKNNTKSVSYDTFRPEENVTREKILKLERVIHSWITEHKYEGEWQIDVAAVELDMKRRIGKFRFIECVY